MMGAEAANAAVSIDLTTVVTAFLGFLSALAAAGVFARRTVRKAAAGAATAAVDAVDAHGVVEAEAQEALKSLQKTILSELRLLRSGVAASNELAAQVASSTDRRLHMVEDRVSALERAQGT